tara:strand:+ start:407 stop:598 length:192 start_codon:yes stop_codon:yes gene_type:complete
VQLCPERNALKSFCYSAKEIVKNNWRLDKKRLNFSHPWGSQKESLKAKKIGYGDKDERYSAQK